MAAPRSAFLNVMVDAAEKAGRALVRDFGEVEQLQISRKGPGDFVSAADLKSEKILKETLAKARPSFGFLLEEGGEIKGADASYRWIIDPLDGTTNFLHGIPHWCILIALEKDKEIVAAVAHDPIKNELFHAEKGGGAFMNNKRLRVSGRTAAEECLFAIGGGKPQDILADISVTPDAARSMRRFGSAGLDLAYVAAGRYDAYWERGLNAWDVAAGSLLVKEAGGFVTDFDSGKNYIYGRSVIAANPRLHPELVQKIKAADAPSKTKTTA